MNTSVNTDDVIFNFFKQICDEKDDQKCVELGNEWIKAMETNLSEMEKNLNGADYIKHKDDIQSNRNHLDSLKNKTSSEWRQYATQCMIEIMNHKESKIMSNQERVFLIICASLIIFTLHYLIEKHFF